MFLIHRKHRKQEQTLKKVGVHSHTKIILLSWGLFHSLSSCQSPPGFSTWWVPVFCVCPFLCSFISLITEQSLYISCYSACGWTDTKISLSQKQGGSAVFVCCRFAKKSVWDPWTGEGLAEQLEEMGNRIYPYLTISVTLNSEASGDLFGRLKSLYQLSKRL